MIQLPGRSASTTSWHVVSRDPSDRTDTYTSGDAVSERRSPRVLGDYYTVRSARCPRDHWMGCGVPFGRRYDIVGRAPSRSLMRLSTRPGSLCVQQSPTGDEDEPGSSRARGVVRCSGLLYRILGTVVALLGLANTAIVVRETGEAVYGLVSWSRRLHCFPLR